MRITKSEGQAIDKMISDTISQIIIKYSDQYTTDKEDVEQATMDILKFLDDIGYQSTPSLICDNCGDVIKPNQRTDGCSHYDCNFPD